MYDVQRMKKATFDWMSLQTVRCHHIRWPLVQIVYLLFNTSCSYGDLNAAIRFGSRLTGAKINIIYEKIY